MNEIYERLSRLSATKLALLAQEIDSLKITSTGKQNSLAAKRLVAYIVCDENKSITPGELRNFVSNRLPDYMVPSAFVMLDAFPLTSSGKIDREALPTPMQSASDLDPDFVAPRNPVEEVLSIIWAEILDTEPIGAFSNFFALGGHSLAAAQVIYRVRDLFQVELPVRCLFTGPTLAELAQALIASEAVPGTTEKIARAYKKVKSLSPEEVKRLLKEKKKAV